MTTLNGVEIVFYYLVCFVGPIVNLGGWTNVAHHGLSGWTVFVALESATLLVLWVEPFLKIQFLTQFVRFFLYLEMVFLLGRLILLPFAAG